MDRRLKLFFSYALFWLAYFIISKVAFLLYHLDKALELSTLSIFKIFFFGMRMDLSTVGYIMVAAGLIIVFTVNNPKSFRLSFSILTLFLLIINSFLLATDMELYRIWGYRLDATPLLYIQTNAAGAFALGDNWVIVRQIGICITMIVAFWWVYKKIILIQIPQLPKSGLKWRFIIFILTGLMFFPIRSTLGMVPLNLGFVYFHNSNMFANHAAINLMWNVVKSVTKLNKVDSPKDFYDKQETEKIWDKLYSKKPASQEKVITTNRPNIILISLENYTAKFIEKLGGKAGISPNLDSLVEEGILFTNFFSNGDRTEKGLVSILSAYPAHPTSSTIKYPPKTQHMGFINKALKKAGYASTGVISGYDMTYANFRSYFNNAQFEKITSQSDFDPSIEPGKWGIDDHYVFEKLLDDINQMEQPFFEMCITLSSHHPFDVPMPTVIEGEDEESRFLNSAYYTDKYLGKFLRLAKKEPWWKNTWIIITADHGNPVPRSVVNGPEGTFRIPMIWAGGAVSAKDSVVSTFGGQVDIAQSIMGQIDYKTDDFSYSRDLMAPEAKSFTFYTFNNGFGYLNDSTTLIFDNVSRKYMTKEGSYSQQDMNNGKALMQKIYSDIEKL